MVAEMARKLLIYLIYCNISAWFLAEAKPKNYIENWAFPPSRQEYTTHKGAQASKDWNLFGDIYQ